MSWPLWQGSSWGGSNDSWHSDRSQEVETGGIASLLAKKVWNACVQLGGTTKSSMPLEDRMRLIRHMIPSARMMKLLTLSAEQVDAVIFIASGQQPDLKLKQVADTRDELFAMFKEEYLMRKDQEAAGLPDMLDSDSSRLVPFATELSFTPCETVGPPSQHFSTLRIKHLFTGQEVFNLTREDCLCVNELVCVIIGRLLAI